MDQWFGVNLLSNSGFNTIIMYFFALKTTVLWFSLKARKGVKHIMSLNMISNRYKHYFH